MCVSFFRFLIQTKITMLFKHSVFSVSVFGAFFCLGMSKSIILLYSFAFLSKALFLDREHRVFLRKPQKPRFFLFFVFSAQKLYTFLIEHFISTNVHLVNEKILSPYRIYDVLRLGISPYFLRFYIVRYIYIYFIG